MQNMRNRGSGITSIFLTRLFKLYPFYSEKRLYRTYY